MADEQTTPTKRVKAKKRRLPILVRHAVSLALVFAIALPVSYHVGLLIYQHLQLSKLANPDDETFNQGLSYVYQHAADSDSVTKQAIDAALKSDDDRAAELLVTVAIAYGQEELAIPSRIVDAASSLFDRMPPLDSLWLYDALYQVPNLDTKELGKQLLAKIDLPAEPASLTTVDLLEQRLLWSEEQAPLDKWLNWLTVLSQSEAMLTQYKAARLVGKLPEEADNTQVLETLAALSRSKHDRVRNQALISIAGYAAIAKDSSGYEQLIFELGQDENKVIARRAWMVVGHLNPFSGFAVNWKEADPFVAEAMLWASVKTNPENAKPAIDAWHAGKQIISAHALHQAAPKYDVARSPAGKILLDSLTAPPLNDSDVLRFWRSLPILHDDWMEVVYGETPGKLFPTLLNDLDYTAIRSGKYRGVFEAAVYYSRIGFEPTAWKASDEGLVAAWIEGLHRGPLESLNARPKTYYQATDELWSAGQFEALKLDLPKSSRFNKERQQFRTILAAAGSDDPRGQFLITDSTDAYSNDPLTMSLWIAIHAEGARNMEPANRKPPHIDSAVNKLRSFDLPRRNASALYTGMVRYPATLVTGASAAFFEENPTLSRKQINQMTDAQLSEYGLNAVDALTSLLEAAEAAPASAGRQPEAKLLRLALWMRGDYGQAFNDTAEAMLFDETLPTTTVLMCLLHMKRPIALDYLFGDFGNPPPDLYELLIQKRYWHVFRRLVDTSDLPLWLWGDPEAQAFQIDAMRQWYAVNRWKIQRGWWPDPTGQ